MSALYEELRDLEGILSQNPETGALNEKTSYLGEYTNRLFGAPYQLMDDVDKRFPEINSDIGNGYLKNIMLNAPIVHIRPGMPIYTGKDKSGIDKVVDSIKNMYWNNVRGDSTDLSGLLDSLAQNTLFGKGSKLQKRMFGFRETYYDYMQHVNYMCRSVAVLLNLTTDQDKLPWGTYTSTKSGIKDNMDSFSNMKWENYRMLKKSYVKDPLEYLGELVGDVVDGIVSSVVGTAGAAMAGFLTNGLTDDPTAGTGEGEEAKGSFMSQISDTLFNRFTENTLAGSLVNKVTAVEFMIEPGSFVESLSNETTESQISAAINSVGDAVGKEIAFITNSNADTGVLGDVMGFLGDTLESASTAVAGIVEGATGGFMTNLFTGALQSIKGQKMIYPKIYDKSHANMNYTFDIMLSSPYGDVYNYYMNIVVPLMHLIALAAPRMVTANSIASPYLIQFYIPGQCTCHLGIVQNLTITKNPNQERVSVNGFPLEVKVQVQIEELYNAMSISPANDPASFLFNETLNDYLANTAGLIPSVDTYVKQRNVMFGNLNEYFTSGEWMNDMVSGVIEKVEDFINPFVGR